MLARRSLLAVALAATVLTTAGAKKAAEHEPMAIPLDPAQPRDKAILEARKKVAADEASAEARVLLGNAYYDRGWVRDALVQYEEAARLEPEYSVAWNNAGIVQEMIGESRDAQASFRQAVEADEYNPEAHFNLARILERAGSFDDAVKHYVAALRLKPDLGEVTRNPRVRSSKLLLSAKLAVYRATTAGSLPPLGPAGESGLERLMVAPGGMGSGVFPTPSPGASPTPTASPTPAPTPIVIGPGPGSAAGSRPSGDSPRPGTMSGRGIRRGVPQPVPPVQMPPSAPRQDQPPAEAEGDPQTQSGDQ